jgi:hypothetical protein
MIFHKPKLERLRTSQALPPLFCAILLLAPAAAMAQQTPSLLLPLPPADTGKPMVFALPDRLAAIRPPPPRGCGDALACRLWVIGEVRRGGAVELKATAFSW